MVRHSADPAVVRPWHTEKPSKAGTSQVRGSFHRDLTLTPALSPDSELELEEFGFPSPSPCPQGASHLARRQVCQS